jgi:CubicO group peptidase (beta-lactamase class C family)
MTANVTATALTIAHATVWLLPNVLAAQTDESGLRLLGSVERSLAPAEQHAYTVDLETGQFAFVAVQQMGIDVRVTVTDPAGELVTDVDSPNGSQGLEPVALVPRISGTYSIAVRPLMSVAEAGRYAIALERLEPVASSDAGRVDQLFAAWDRPGSPGAAVVVAQNGEIAHSAGYGFANLEYDVPITPSTVFHVASVSKQFTAYAITMLAAAGQISLDDDIRAYVPELHDFGSTITIRHLLHHTSGLRDQWALLTLAGWRMDDVITREQILRLISRQRYLNFEPGAEYLYSNTGFTLLAEIVARVTGQPFPEWAEQHMFQPLGMNSTHFHYDHETIVPNRAYSYRSDSAGGFRKSVLSYANVGATSLFTTVEDLARWAGNFETGTVGGSEVVRMMRTRGVLNGGDSLDYAFGQAIGSYHGLRALSHSGADAGFRSYLIRFPHQRTSVAVLSNVASFDASSMARQVADIYLADQFVTATTDSEESGARVPAEIQVDPRVLDGYVGDYQMQPGVLVTISRDGNRLLADATGRQQVRLIPTSESRFFVEGTDVYIEFERDARGSTLRLAMVEAGNTLVAPRIEPFDATGVRLAEFVGRFYSEELATMYTLVVEDGALVAKHLRHDPIVVTPAGPDAFAGDAWFMTQLVFERSDAGRIVGLRVSSGRVRNLWFGKQR